MKKVLISILLFVVFPLTYVSWPIYQGLAYKDKLPLIGFDFVSWPSEQPAQNEVMDPYYRLAGQNALKALVRQQAEISAPGYTAAVAIDGKVVWAGSVGWADIAAKKPMTTDSQMRVGSTSKAITSVGLARLVADKKLDLDAPASSYFDALPNPAWSNVTARQLSSHMAGIPHYNENTELLGVIETVRGQTHYADVMDAVTLFDESAMTFAPGEKFSYSSLGTVLLSAFMQIKAEQSYQDFMASQVFAPLQMNATYTEQPNRDNDQLVTSYWQNWQQNRELKPWYDVDLSHRLAGGGWVSTSKDLVKLAQGFMNEDFVPANIRNQFWTPQRLNNGEVNPQNYGIGWRIHDLDLGEGFETVKYMHHGGVSSGAQSFLMVIPKYNMSISVNANLRTKVFRDFGKVSFDVARAFIEALANP